MARTATKRIQILTVVQRLVVLGSRSGEALRRSILLRGRGLGFGVVPSIRSSPSNIPPSSGIPRPSAAQNLDWDWGSHDHVRMTCGSHDFGLACRSHNDVGMRMILVLAVHGVSCELSALSPLVDQFRVYRPALSRGVYHPEEPAQHAFDFQART